MMILLSIYIEFCFQTTQYISLDALAQSDTSFKYLWVFGRIFICVISIFFNTSGTLGSLKDIFIMIVAFLMILMHYSYMPFKNFQIQLITGGVLLWYFERTILYFLFHNIQISMDSFIIDFSLIQLFLLCISTKYYSIVMHQKLSSYFMHYKDTKQDANKFLVMIRYLVISRTCEHASYRSV